MVRAGGAAVAENPGNSYNLRFRTLQEYLDLPGVKDYFYVACALGGARAKKQRLRGNVVELSLLSSKCRRTHSEQEWQRWKGTDGQWKYPTKG